jgi:hypothetical protein
MNAFGGEKNFECYQNARDNKKIILLQYSDAIRIIISIVPYQL